MKKYLQKVLCMAVLVSLLCTGCAPQPIVQKSVDTAMGTIISQTLYVENSSVVSQEVLSCIDSLEKDYLSWRLEGSEIYRINESAGSGQELELSDKLAEALAQCKRVYAASDGAFAISIGSVARLWNIDAWAAEQQSVVELPKEADIAETLKSVQLDELFLEGSRICIPEGMQLDMGAVGKGIALDEIKTVLAQHKELTGAVISVGGSILTYDSKPDGGSWNVAIVNPFNTSQNLGVLTLKGQWCISTSGDYERYVEVDGVRYHHILDPATGMPAKSGVKSVTILTDSGLFSDALSTACFVLGVEEGMKLAENFQAEALFVDEQGEIFMTEGMEQYFHLSNAEK